MFNFFIIHRDIFHQFVNKIFNLLHTYLAKFLCWTIFFCVDEMWSWKRHCITGYDRKFVSSMFLPGDAFGFLHKKSSEALVLKLVRVSGGDGNDAAVDVKFSNDWNTVFDFWPEKSTSSFIKELRHSMFGLLCWARLSLTSQVKARWGLAQWSFFS